MLWTAFLLKTHNYVAVASRTNSPTMIYDIALDKKESEKGGKKELCCCSFSLAFFLFGH